MNAQHLGWKCPDCGRCYAPTIAECGTCNAFAAQAQPHLPFPTWPDTTTIPYGVRFTPLFEYTEGKTTGCPPQQFLQ